MLIINKRNHVFVTSAKVARNFWNLKAKNSTKQTQLIREKNQAPSFNACKP